MTLLIDFDSILYKSVYRCLNRPENKELGIPKRTTRTYCRELLKEYDKTTAKDYFLAEVYNQSLNRCENEFLKMKVYLESILNSEITDYELYITTCKNSFRKQLTPTYKANRKVRNKYVSMIREYYQDNEAFYSDTLEADDLIAMRVEELGRENCIVASLDKDLRTIGGFLWNYQKVAETDLNGEITLNEYGHKEMYFKHNEVEWITQQMASYYFWLQMLMGDSGDGIKGLKRVGIKTAEKILADSSNYFVTTAKQYISRGQKKDFWINYKLLKLGKNDNG